MSALSLRRVRRRLQQIANARPRGDAEHVGAAAQGPGVGTDPTSTVGRQESKPLVRECGWCSRVWNGSAWVTAPLGIDRRGFTTGLCGDCYHTHFGAYEHAHEAVAS